MTPSPMEVAGDVATGGGMPHARRVTPSPMEVAGGGMSHPRSGGGMPHARRVTPSPMEVGGRMPLGDITNVPKVSLTYIYACM